jgi:glutamine synthetase
MRIKLKEAGFPIESTKGEAGFGQHEINVAHAECLRMSDSAVALKLVNYN